MSAFTHASRRRAGVPRRSRNSSSSSSSAAITALLFLFALSVLLAAVPVHALQSVPDAPYDFLSRLVDLYRSSPVSSVTCLNGGVPVDDHCDCGLYYTSANCSERQCPNSINGTGPHAVLPVDNDTKLCDSCDRDNFQGLSCQLCQSNSACAQYAGSNAVCDTGIPIRGDNKQFQCTLNNPFFVRMMGGGRNISAEITLNCSTSDGTAFQKSSDGKCEMTVYRVEPNESYVDPFFRCSAEKCTQTTVEGLANETLGQKAFFRAVRTGGQVMLVCECALLAALGCFTKMVGPRRTRKITVALAATISVTVVLYIALMMISMQPATVLNSTVVYECQKTTCACAEDPPEKYDPICSQTPELNTSILPSIKNKIRFDCAKDGSSCNMTLADLSLVFTASCNASECVDPQRFPSDSDDGGNHGGLAILSKVNLFLLLFLLVLFVAGGVGIHYHYTRRISHERGKEFLVTFHVNTLYANGDENENENEGEGDDDDDGVSPGGTASNGHRAAASQSRSAQVTILDGGDDDEPGAGEGVPLLHDSTALRPEQQGAALMPLGGSPSSRRAGSNASLRASVYEQAQSLTLEEVAHIERLRRLTAAPLELQVSDLRYTLSVPLLGAKEEGTQRTLLHGINFTAYSGDVLAIMGPSGAGKTTLLDLLSARSKSGSVSGTVALNGTPITSAFGREKQYRNIIGYVSQEDTLLPSLTVEQTIFYAARLKLPKALSRNTVRRIVARIIDTLKLQHCAQTVIGGDTSRGISGGEKRRVSIAVELLANPRILFLDEPTSGLDTISAKRVIEAVVELAKDSPMRMYAPHYFAFRPIVIFSIHQPSQEIFELFDKVLLLSAGMSIYCGPAANAAAALEQRVTAAFGHTRDVPRKEDNNNPAEYVMKVEEMLDDAVRAELQEEDAATNRSAPASTGSPARTQVPPCRSPDASPMPRPPSQPGGSARGTDAASDVEDGERDLVSGEDILTATFGFRVYYANVYEQLHLLISRSVSCLVASFHLVMCHAAVVACLATLMSALYQSQALDLPGTMNRAGSMSFLLLVTSFVSLSSLEQLLLERKLFNVERENGFYTTWPYLISKIVVDIIPLRVVPATVLAAVIYFPMGFRVDAGVHFFYFILIIVLFSICITMMILCIGILNGSFGAAALLSSVFILWNFVFGGALVQSDTIPSKLRLFKSMSPFFLAFEPLMVNELNNQRCTFAPTDASGKQSDVHVDIMCTQYLSNLGLKPAQFNADVMQLAIYCLLFIVLAWVLLTTCSKLVR